MEKNIEKNGKGQFKATKHLLHDAKSMVFVMLFSCENSGQFKPSQSKKEEKCLIKLREPISFLYIAQKTVQYS